jgi:hypothetical protein
MQHGDFNLRALYDALDEQRRAQSMSWTAVRWRGEPLPHKLRDRCRQSRAFAKSPSAKATASCRGC